jgi:transglutaminase-like putative cysteine protease
VRVHTEYLSNLGPGRHFACVDLADESGDVYDVDFFLSGQSGEMNVTETTVHKHNGKPFYTWKQQKDKTWKRVPVKNAGTRLLGVIEGEDRFIFTYSFDVPASDSAVVVWVPVSQDDEFQKVELNAIKAAIEKREFVSDTRYGNRILYLEVPAELNDRRVSLEYSVRRFEKGPYADPQIKPADYLESSALLPVGGRFSTQLNEIISRRPGESKLEQARAIYDHIADTLRYRKAGQYGTGDANYACDSRSGNCTEFHSLFISLARTAGIPARFAIGAAIPSDRNEGGIDGYHCWAEFYAEEQWWPVDLSEANKYPELSAYYFGHHPANRVELSKGRDIELTPPAAGGTVPFFAYPVMESNGGRTTLKPELTFVR